MHEEFQFLKAQFTRAGYPISLIDTKINQTQTHMLGYGQVKQDNEEQLSNTWIVLHLPWSGEAADKEIGKVKRMLPRDIVRVSIAYQTQKFRSLLPRFQPSQENSQINRTVLQNDCVYKYTCGKCNKVYIGETKRRLAVRIEEHGMKSKPMQKHIEECKAVWEPDKFKIVARGLKGATARKKYETMYIKFFMKLGKCLNICEISRDLCIF